MTDNDDVDTVHEMWLWLATDGLLIIAFHSSASLLPIGPFREMSTNLSRRSEDRGSNQKGQARDLPQPTRGRRETRQRAHAAGAAPQTMEKGDERTRQGAAPPNYGKGGPESTMWTRSAAAGRG